MVLHGSLWFFMFSSLNVSLCFFMFLYVSVLLCGPISLYQFLGRCARVIGGLSWMFWYVLVILVDIRQHRLFLTSQAGTWYIPTRRLECHGSSCELHWLRGFATRSMESLTSQRGTEFQALLRPQDADRCPHQDGCYIFTYVYLCIYIYIHVYMYKYMCIYIYIYLHIYLFIIYLFNFIHVYIYIYVCAIYGYSFMYCLFGQHLCYAPNSFGMIVILGDRYGTCSLPLCWDG